MGARKIGPPDEVINRRKYYFERVDWEIRPFRPHVSRTITHEAYGVEIHDPHAKVKPKASKYGYDELALAGEIINAWDPVEEKYCMIRLVHDMHPLHHPGIYDE